MKFIYVTCNISMVEIVWDLLDELEILNYQTIDVVTAKSSYANPRLNTAVWPGYNASIVIQEANDEKVNELFKELKEMNEKVYNSAEIVAAHMWEVYNSI